MICDHSWNRAWNEAGEFVQCCSRCKKIEVVEYKSILLGALNDVYSNKEIEIEERNERIQWLENRLSLYTSEELMIFLNVPKDEIFGGVIEIKGAYAEWLSQFEKWNVDEPKSMDPRDLISHPLNPSIYGDKEDVHDLVQAIGANGWVKPLVINRKRQVVSGNRRLLAVLELGLDSVPVEVRRFSCDEQEFEALLMENMSRDKTRIQRYREGVAWKNIPGWLEAQRKAYREKHQVDNKISVKTRDILAEKAGLGSGGNFQKVKRIVEWLDLLKSEGRPEIGDEILDQLNNDSVDKAYKSFQEWERRFASRYRYIGFSKIVGSEGTISLTLAAGDEVIFAKEAQDSNPDFVIVRLVDHPNSYFRVKGIDLQIISSELAEVKARKILPEQEKPKSLFKEGDSVISSYKELAGKVVSVSWHDGGYWLCKVDWEDDSRSDVTEDKLSLQTELFTPIKSWNPRCFLTDGAQIGVVMRESVFDVQIQWLGIGHVIAPSTELVTYDLKDYKLFLETLEGCDYDPFNSPKCYARHFLKGDIVSTKAKKEPKTGVIEKIDGDGFLIRWNDSFASRLNDDQVRLCKPFDRDFYIGDKVKILCKGGYFSPSAEKLRGKVGILTKMFRTCADIQLDGGETVRVFYDWLKGFDPFDPPQPPFQRGENKGSDFLPSEKPKPCSVVPLRDMGISLEVPEDGLPVEFGGSLDVRFGFATQEVEVTAFVTEYQSGADGFYDCQISGLNLAQMQDLTDWLRVKIKKN